MCQTGALGLCISTSHTFLCSGAFKTIPIRVHKSFIVVISFLFRKHLGTSVGFPEALVWIALFAFLYVFNVSNVTNKMVSIMCWACASQQAIPSRVRELSKTIAIRFQKFHCFDQFSVQEASGHFCWFSGSACLNDVVCILIRFQCFECCKQNCANGALGLCISTSDTFSCSGAFKNHCHSCSKVSLF